MKIVCISDTHGKHRGIRVPDGDLLIHAGDFTALGEFTEITSFNAWLGELPHRHKVVTGGNHDILFERNPNLARSLITNATYLEDSGCSVEGLDIWGSPWQPAFNNWAFNLPRGKALREKWDLIPAGIDILVTHGPPHSILDSTFQGEMVGCEELMKAVRRVKPRLHVFGHIHPSSGLERQGATLFVNASIAGMSHLPKHPPRVVELEP